MMSNNKRFPTGQNQQMPMQNPRPTYPRSQVPLQGGGQPNSNAPQYMRVQNGPRQPQPQQSQLHTQQQQQQHATMAGVPGQQHPHTHPNTVPQQGQPQSFTQQQLFQFPANAISPYNFIQLPYPMQPGQMGQQAYIIQPNATARFMSPSAPVNYYSYQNPPQQLMYHTQGHQGQPNVVQQHAPANQHPAYYPNPYTIRVPVQSVHTPVQVPAPHHATAPPHTQQQPAQQHHPIPHTSQPPPTSTTPTAPRSNEGASAASSSQRKKKVLQITDPTTGVCIFGDNATSAAATDSVAEVAQPEGSGDVAAASTPVPPSDSQTPEVSALGPPDEEDKEEGDKGSKAPSEEQGSESKTKARAEFYQKITQASDDGGRATGGPGNSQGAVVSPPSPIPASVAPEPESPPIDSSRSQQAVSTPAANTSSDDSKDASLVSVSPIPIECYVTPEKTSSPATVDEKTFEDENEVLSQNEDETSLTALEDKGKVFTRSQLEKSVVESGISLPEVNHSGIDTERKEENDEVSSVNEKSESTSIETPNEEQASVVHQNGELEDLEEGEIVPEDENGDAQSGAEDSAVEPAKPSEATKDETKEKLKYGRQELLNIGNQTKLPRPTNLLSDVIKDAHSMRGQNLMKSPGGGRGEFGRGPRGGPGPGPKPMGGIMGMNYGPRGGGGMMGWQGLIVPPRLPPPKVIELTREEVKLHKAENAWKPTAIKHRGSGSDQQDPEVAVTDDIVKKTRGILNKLTPENSTKLLHKFMNLPLEDKEDRISKVIKVVFEKAVDEPSFSKEYATMVTNVCNMSPPSTAKIFRKQILDQCQQEFQNTDTDETKMREIQQQLEEATEQDKKDQIKAELEEYKYQSRRRSVGNIRFIGELYKLQMLTPKIMIECVALLLSNSDEESLECLCKLLTTVGLKLEDQLQSLEQREQRIAQEMRRNPSDTSDQKRRFIPEENWMRKTFDKLKNLSNNLKYSSRIRFALLDVVELRDCNWIPRRDANAPKTIEEVHKDAFKQQQEEKSQIRNLPPVVDQRNSSRPGPTLPKKGEWNVQSSAKSSRFQVAGKKIEPQQGTTPTFGPPAWAKSAVGGSGGMPNKTQNTLPPRFQQQQQQQQQQQFQNRYQSLADDRDKDRLNSNQPPPMSFRDSGPPISQSPFGGASLPSHRISPAPSSTSSRESSRPVSPKDTSSAVTSETCTFNINQTVKSIFEEYCSVGIISDSIEWIKEKFPDNKVIDFVDELSKQVSEMSKQFQQHKAGSLVRSLIKNNEINLSKDAVLSTLSQGVVTDLPDIRIDVPMVSSYLAQFLIEIFHDERNLDWLLQVSEGLQASDDEGALNDFYCQTLTALRAKKNEEFVRTMYSSTEGRDKIPLDDLTWLCPNPESLAQEMVPVLKNVIVNSKDGENEVRQALKEHSWDLREDVINHSLIEAVCIVSWNPELSLWDKSVLQKLLPVLPQYSQIFPSLWKRVCDFVTRNEIAAAQKDELWEFLYMNNVATSKEQPCD